MFGHHGNDCLSNLFLKFAFYDYANGYNNNKLKIRKLNYYSTYNKYK